METAVFEVSAAKASVKIRRPLVLGSTYAVQLSGCDAGGEPPAVVLAWHGGEPLAVSEVLDGGAHVIALDSQALLDLFKACGNRGCPQALAVHCYVMTGDGTLAEGMANVLWAPYLVGGAQITKIDVKGPKGDKGDPGPKGDKGDMGASGVLSDSPVWFTVDLDAESATYGHLFVHARDALRLYAADAQGAEDTARPLWELDADPASDTCGHVLYHSWTSDGRHRVLDLGRAAGPKGDQGEPGQEGPSDTGALAKIAAAKAVLAAASATEMPENPEAAWDEQMRILAEVAASLA